MTDFEKLLIFANVIDVPVRHAKLERGDAGYFVYDGVKSRIELNLKKKRDTYETLVLLHELGHAVDWIELGRPDGKLISGAVWEGKTAADRFLVYQYELRATNKMMEIHKLLNLKVPIKKLEIERRYDLWVAQMFLETGQYPAKTLRKTYRQELKRLSTLKD